MNTEREVIGKRVFAALIDLLVVFAVFHVGQLAYLGELQVPEPIVVLGSLVWFVFNVFGLMPFFLFRQGDPMLIFLAAAGTWAVYATVLEWLFGRTIGKRLTGLVVVSKNGARPAPSAILTRNVLRVVDALVFYVVGFLVIVVTDRGQRTGDLIAGTVVVASADDS